MTVLEYDFDLGETVYLKTDGDQSARMVTAIQVSLGGGTIYRLAHGVDDSWHYPQELSRERDVIKAMGVENKEADN